VEVTLTVGLGVVVGVTSEVPSSRITKYQTPKAIAASRRIVSRMPPPPPRPPPPPPP
jgi:hypothetical protein